MSEPAVARPAPPRSDRRIDSLTGIRFFAAFAVVLHHYRFFLSAPALVPVMEQGRAAVSLFFILSGFILTYNYHRWFSESVPRARYRQFMRARFARVYPMHLCSLLLVTPVVLYLLHAHFPLIQHDYNTALTHRMVSVSWLANLLLVQVYVPLSAVNDLWNGPSWSIACEFFFYAVFPFFLSGVLRRFPHTRAIGWLTLGLFSVEIGALLCFLLMVELSPFGQGHKIALAYYLAMRLPFLRIWEFFIGCVLGISFVIQGNEPRTAPSDPLWMALHRRATRNGVLAAALLGALLVAVACGSAAGGWQSALPLLEVYAIYTPLFALIIAALASGPTFLSGLLEHPWMVLLGEASYSLYMLHWIPYLVLSRWRLMGELTVWYWVPIFIIGSVIASLISLKLIEMPARKALRGPSGVPSLRAAETGSLATAAP